ncbi:unnamed protein product [Parascedosporium putredinis]|uniref:Uncharacterized protein n=1 Tax=Parascedosporium putredinis TaxID=1442378 RepID=A0A9P1H940_9PEZI|nr:unnamed protein product [Parascedosporium putredinis]CAI8001309.1 unnamed protein product [Parascedosporium putredinis]
MLAVKQSTPFTYKSEELKSGEEIPKASPTRNTKHPFRQLLVARPNTRPRPTSSPLLRREAGATPFRPCRQEEADLLVRFLTFPILIPIFSNSPRIISLQARLIHKRKRTLRPKLARFTFIIGSLLIRRERAVAVVPPSRLQHL